MRGGLQPSGFPRVRPALLRLCTAGAAGGARGGTLELPRRDLFIWVCAVLFFNHLFSVFGTMASTPLAQLATDLGTVGFFQYMAWYAIFRLLMASDAGPSARAQDVLIATAACIPLVLPTPRVIWVAATCMAVYWLWTYRGDAKLRAAAIVLAALSVQQLWGYVFFHLFAFPLLCAETAVVGTILEGLRAGTLWHNNVIVGPDGYGIVLYDQCSAFHNLSVAMLCWVTISRLRHQFWHRRDLWIGAVVALTMVGWNILRLSFMAWSLAQYEFWHDGAGAQIFALGAALSVLLISLCGTRPARPST